MKHKRVYVCHTYYHMYVACLKELNLPQEERKQATLVLSTMSNNFLDIDVRAKASGLFEDVLFYDEKHESCFPELAKYRRDKGNIIVNMISRIKFTKKFAKAQEPYVPIDFREYEDIYVFCDQDPIGYYLNQNKIYYHAVEDGLDTLAGADGARVTNMGFFKLKCFFSEKLNLIFVCNGYGKYCIDMEVNDISVLKYSYRKYVEVSRRKLADGITEADKQTLVDIFVKDSKQVKDMICKMNGSSKNILVLTEPLCSLEIRERIFRDIFEKYSKEGNVFFKPHPRDELDYGVAFPNVLQFEAYVPMEIFNYFPMKFDKIVSVFTPLDAINFAIEKERLGSDFMDKYEEAALHRKNEYI